MATRQARLSEFNHGIPKANRRLQLLCEDHCGTYVIPYACQWTDGAWRRVGSPNSGPDIMSAMRENDQSTTR